MNYIKALVVSIAILLTSGCGTQVLRANFDSDPLGGLPLASPPGDPVGDSVWLGTLVSSIEPHAVIIISDGAISGQSLRYSNADIPGLVREVRFYSKELGSRRPKYWAAWSGRIEDVTDSTSPLIIHFGNFTIGYASFKIQSGKLWVRRTPERGSGYEPVGDLAAETVHTVVVMIDDQTETFNIAIFPRRGRTLNVVSRPLESRSIFTERRLNIQLRFDGGSNSGASYVIDDIIITEKEPDM